MKTLQNYKNLKPFKAALSFDPGETNLGVALVCYEGGMDYEHLENYKSYKLVWTARWNLKSTEENEGLESSMKRLIDNLRLDRDLNYLLMKTTSENQEKPPVLIECQDGF